MAGRTWWGIALIVGMASGCSSAGGGADSGQSFAQMGTSTVTVEVLNRNFAQATLWWQSRGSRQRLGIVEGNTTRVFTIQRFTVSQPVFLEINLTAGQRCVTSEIMTDPGDQLYLEIAPNFRDTPNCR